MKNIVYAGAFASALTLAGCGPQSDHKAPEPKPITPLTSKVLKSPYEDLFFKVGGTCATKLTYTTQKTRFETIGYTTDGAEVRALILLVVGANHRYEMKYIESDRKKIADDKFEWFANREKPLIGDWQMTASGVHLLGLGLIQVDTSQGTPTYSFQAERNLISDGLSARSFELLPDVSNLTPFADINGCK